MDKWAEMQVFVEAVKRGSFSAAGRQLNLSPSAISKLLSRLESRLGVRLINRTTRSLSLTEGGERYFKRCQEILTDIESAEDSLTSFVREPTGTLRVNSTQGFATKVNHNSPYAVTVQTAPNGYTCTVANGSGTATADVGNVTVACKPFRHSASMVSPIMGEAEYAMRSRLGGLRI